MTIGGHIIQIRRDFCKRESENEATRFKSDPWVHIIRKNEKDNRSRKTRTLRKFDKGKKKRSHIPVKSDTHHLCDEISTISVLLP